MVSKETMKQDLRDLNWLYVPWAAFLFALGGWAFKPFRRLLLPVTGGILARAYGVSFWRCTSYTLLTFLVFSLSYSPDRHHWGYLAMVGAGYGTTPMVLLPSLKKGLLAPAISCGGFLWVVWMSLMWGLPWKLAEIAMGALHGYWVAWAIQQRRAR